MKGRSVSSKFTKILDIYYWLISANNSFDKFDFSI